ncbi:MAG: hypothetical protein Q4Q06_06945 [Bacteroidota bacterium]|nr:hypothetical protein [Bacteroidota bacterium]
MKKIFTLAIIVANICLLVSCTTKKEQELREQHLKDSFNSLVTAQKNEIATMLAQMKDIDNSLNDIASQYTELQTITNKMEGNDETLSRSIVAKINAMADMIAKDKEKIKALQGNLARQKNSFAENKRLQEQLSSLNGRLGEREDEIISLTKQLQEKNANISDLNSQVAKLQQETKKNKTELSRLEDERYTAYFIVGTKKELKKAGVIDSEGGFIGLGKTLTLAANSNIDNMQRIDMRNVDEIPLTGGKVKLITPHPTNSYTLQGGANKATSIKIESMNEFWKNSRLLVIMVK